MTASAVLDLLVQIGNQIDNLWSMYIVVHLGLFWFFFLVHRPLLFIERTIAIFAYAAFATINGQALISTYKFLESIRLDLINRFASELGQTPEIANALVSVSYQGKEHLILITHGCAFGVVALFLIFRNTMIRRYERFFPRHVQTGGGSVLD